MAKITAPVKGYTGTTAGVSFTDGVGHTEDGWLKEWFAQRGYTVGPEITAEAENRAQATSGDDPGANTLPPVEKPLEAPKKAPAKKTTRKGGK